MAIDLVTSLAIAAGGAIGSLGRYWLTIWLAPVSQAMPWGTMLINVAGSFAIAFVGTLTMTQDKAVFQELWRVAFMVGVCGGFTTFSSFSLQTLDLALMGAGLRAAVNIGLTVALCLTAVTAGHLSADRLTRDPRPQADATS